MTPSSYNLTHLKVLEAESIHIIREVAAEFEKPVLLFSGGKDSIVMLHLALKAFRPGRLPFPVMHVDTGHNFDEVLAVRDELVAESGVRLVVAKVQDDIDAGRYEKLYNDAAPEWRADAGIYDSKATLQRLRDKLGKPGVRDQQTAREEDTGTGHTVIVIYQTSFERGEAMETFTLV